MNVLTSALQVSVLSTRDTFNSLELVVVLVVIVLLVRYEYLRRVADIDTKRQIIAVGSLAAVMLLLFTGIIIRRVVGFGAS